MTKASGGLTACTPVSAPGPTLGNEYGKPLPLPFFSRLVFSECHCWGNNRTLAATNNVLVYMHRSDADFSRGLFCEQGSRSYSTVTLHGGPVALRSVRATPARICVARTAAHQPRRVALSLRWTQSLSQLHSWMSFSVFRCRVHRGSHTGAVANRK